MTIIIILALITKLLLLFNLNKDLKMNVDEEVNYQIASNNHNGNGHTIYDDDKKQFKQTAFHGLFPILTYEFLIKNEIKKETWVIFIYLFSIILFALSINYFYKICLLYFESEKYALYSTITYCLYPSILFYIGTLFSYENFVLSLLVIIIFKLLRAIKNGFIKTDYFVIPLAVSLSCLFRSQTIVIYFFIFSVYIFSSLSKKSYSRIPLLILTIVFTFLCHVPILLENKKIWGEYILSTQSGFELLQGHNPIARGSWINNWTKPDNDLYKYAHSQIKNINELNELQESEARQQISIKWIKENPICEIILDIRKVGIYFLPQNYEVLYGSRIYNPINLIIHALFFCFIFLQLYKKIITQNDLILLSPIVGSIILSVVFFVGYRWRYYAEPFMIIFAWQLILLFKKKYERNKMASFYNSPSISDSGQ